MQSRLKYSALLLIGILAFETQAQEFEKFDLSNQLTEISGLALISENTFVGINDSGNKAELFIFNEKGEHQKTVDVTNATNVDWEDLATDQTYVYIGDIGNNLNKRKDLCVYKVKIDEVLRQTEVIAEKITYSYSDQKSHPPRKANFNYDAEALVAKNDSLWIISKNNAEPWDGAAAVYLLSKEPGEHVATRTFELFIGDKDWWEDAVTGADIYNNGLYVLTYNRIIRFDMNNLAKAADKVIKFNRLTQKESIVVLNRTTIFVADEKQIIVGGGKLYKYTLE